jgi:3-dehydroquinate synthase
VIEKLPSSESAELHQKGAPMGGDDFLMDVSFDVPYRHRVWFCESVFESPENILCCCFVDRDNRAEDDGGVAGQISSKVQVWVDSAVGASNAQFVAGLTDWIEAESGLELTRPAEVIHGGEACKNDPSVVQNLLSAINQDQLDRRSYIVVVGGGAVLDVVGYAAAVAHRGIRLIRFPSTTLAQADSGVGVKNAVNEFDKKNWKGTFAVPWAVVNDYSLLESLPESTFVSGFSEAVKVALLKSRSSFEFLCDNAERIHAREKQVASQAIQESAAHHLRHIADGGDPFEVMEARPLDFGHWSAHKIEAISGYAVSHGDAVSIGLAVDVLYSVAQLGLDRKIADRVIDCLRRLGLPVWSPILDSHRDELLMGLEEFRQHLGGRLTVTMLADVGKPVNVHDIDQPAVVAAIKELRELNARLG